MTVLQAPKPSLVDPFGRRVTYLRLSVTDRCNLRCVYCMAEDMTFLPRAQVLTLEEMEQIAAAFVALGVNKIRLTGGEPLVRNNVLHLATRLSALSGLDELVMTTNGVLLETHADALAAAGVSRLNISIDSLRPDRFASLTRFGELPQVLKGIDAARRAGFRAVKLNCVVMKGFNDDETGDLVQFAVDNGLDIAFIEEMPLGAVTSHDRVQTLVSNVQVRQQLAQRFRLLASEDSTGGPARYWRVEDTATRVGFISPHSNNFCGDCNRVRLTAEGRLLLCLGNDHAADLRQVVRSHPGDSRRLQAAIVEAIRIKPERHYFDPSEQRIVRFMNATGG